MFRYLQELAHRTSEGLARIGAAIVRPIERLIGGATDRVLSATERVDHVESLVVRVLRFVFWPVLLLGRIFKLLLPAVVVDAFASLANSLRGLFVRVGSGLLHLAEMLNLDRLVLAIVWLTQPIWRPLFALGEFFVSWVNTREYRIALKALPAMILAIAVLGVGTWHAVFGKGQIRSNYREAIRDSQEARDYRLTELYEQKLAQLGQDTQLTNFRTALALADEGKLDEAYERMQSLAPEDRPGYPNAHFWIIQRLLSGDLGLPKADADRLAKSHFEQLKALEIDSPMVQLLRAMWLAQENKRAEAVDILEPLVPVLPSAAFERMRLNLALGQRTQAREDARALVTHMKTRPRSAGDLKPTEYQWWLAAEEVLGNLPQMRTILEQWYKVDPDNELARKALSTVCRKMAGNLLRDPVPDEKQIVELWLRAAKLDDSSEALLRLARALYAARNETPVYSRILTALAESPRTPAALLVAVGTEAAQQEQFEDSRPFFAAAISRDETNAVAWNNYGLVLAEEPNAQLDEALDAVNRALKLAPDEHRFRETRGQILIKLEQWQQAIDDLEFALNGLPSLDQIHKSLSIAYSALGQEELAQLHQSQIE